MAATKAWVNKAIEDAGSLPPGSAAPLNSPLFTGAPTAPTPVGGDDSTRLATTAFVQATVGGVLSKSVAGGVNVTLTAVEAGNAVLSLTGVITANIAVIVPTSPTRSWIVKNGTTGAFTVTVKTAAGTGVVCSQGYNATVWTDGTNVLDALTDFDSVALTGNPTAPTPAKLDNDTSLATTAFVKSSGLTSSTFVNVTTPQTLTNAVLGATVQLALASSGTVVLPLASSTRIGDRIEFWSNGAGIGTVSRQGSDVIYINGGTVNHLDLGIGDSLTLLSTGVNWVAVGGTAQLASASLFSYSLASSGYQKLPSGLIIQWGIISVVNAAANATNSATFPIAFPSAVYAASANMVSNSTNGKALGVTFTGLTTINLTNDPAGVQSSTGAHFIAIGC